MRSIFISSLVSSALRLIPSLSPHDRAQETDRVTRLALGDSKPVRLSDATDDPYFKLKTRGRKGSAGRLAQQQLAFAETSVGKRNARGREFSNPFHHPERRKAFDDALKVTRVLFRTESVARDQARRKARAVPVNRHSKREG